MRTYIIEFDDFCDATVKTLSTLQELKTKYQDLVVTLFTIPQRCSDGTIRSAKLHDWIKLAPHGWWHTRGECMAWGKEQALAYIKGAADRGIDLPAFRAPAWLLDQDTYLACKELDYVICDHKDYCIDIEGCRVYRYNDNAFKLPKVTSIHGHLTKTEAVDNYIEDMLKDGRLDLNQKAIFITPVEASVKVTTTTPGLVIS